MCQAEPWSPSCSCPFQEVWLLRVRWKPGVTGERQKGGRIEKGNLEEWGGATRKRGRKQAAVRNWVEPGEAEWGKQPWHENVRMRGPFSTHWTKLTVVTYWKRSGCGRVWPHQGVRTFPCSFSLPPKESMMFSFFYWFYKWVFFLQTALCKYSFKIELHSQYLSVL